MFGKKDFLALDRKHIWHPFTQHKDYEYADPLVIEKAKGLFLYDQNGKTYYDTISSWWTNIHGHCHPKINRAIKKQLLKLDHVNFSGFTHPKAALLSEKLCELLPSQLSRVFYSDNGSTAIEIALKMAFQYFYNKSLNNKTLFAYLDQSYHGDTIGAMSVGGIDSFHAMFSELKFQSIRLPSPGSYDYRSSENHTGNAIDMPCPDELARGLKEFIEKNKEKLAAIIVEPLIQCVGGMRTYPKAYLEELITLAHKNDILVIFDEVATGFGRTGKMFALDHLKQVPDFVCFSKGITGGYLPLGATFTNEKVFEAFLDDGRAPKTFFHGHSFTANPIICSAALENLVVFEKEHTLQKAQESAHYFQKRLRELFQSPLVEDLRYLNLIGAVDLKGISTKSVYELSLKQGLVLRPLGNTIYWFLPLSAGKKDIEIILTKSKNVILEAKNNNHGFI